MNVYVSNRPYSRITSGSRVTTGSRGTKGGMKGQIPILPRGGRIVAALDISHEMSRNREVACFFLHFRLRITEKSENNLYLRTVWGLRTCYALHVVHLCNSKVVHPATLLPTEEHATPTPITMLNQEHNSGCAVHLQVFP